MAKIIFKDADKKYTWHLKKLKGEIERLKKSQWAFFVLGGVVAISGWFLGCLLGLIF